MTGLGLRERRLVIVGAASGIGRQCARLASEEGARLVLFDRARSEFGDHEAAVAAQVDHCGALDITDRAGVERSFRDLGRVDAVILTAAICPIIDWEADGWEESFDVVVDVNVRGPINVARAALRHLPDGEGRLVLTGSVAGRMGGLVSGPHYVASKGGVHALVRWLAQKAASRGICVNGVAPGPTVTPMLEANSVEVRRIPLGRLANPEEIAWPILFLASSRASYMTGAVLDVNGGFYVS